MKIKDFANKHKWVPNVFWIIMTALITILCEKSCNKILPDSPVIVKEVSDSIKVIHSYDFNNGIDSVVNLQLKMKLENVRLANFYEKEVDMKIKKNRIRKYNSVMINSKFPKAKGYSINSAASYFNVQIPTFEGDFLDFDISFFDLDLVKDIYCLSIKIDAINNGKHSVYLDDNYNINNGSNMIRIANTFPKGIYEISVGFFLKKDVNAEYPCYYRIAKTLNKH